MAHANTFDVQKFGWILKEEVEKTANSRYNGDSNVGLGKGFQFWCIKNISPKFTEVQIESARSICEGEGPGDRNIDGAWIDENRLYIMQSKFSKLVKKDSDNGNDLEIAKFDATAAEELWNGFEQLELNGADSTVKGKIAQVKRLYNEAIGSHKEIRLIIVVSGYAKKDLIDEVKAINKRFENDRQRYKQHHCDLYDIEMLNQVVSDNTSKPPDSFILRTENDVIIPEVSDQNSTYSVLAVVKAKELIQIRDKHGYNIYHSNFRFVIGTGTARNKMIATLSDPEEKLNFFRYNNGITVCCKSIKDEKGHKFLIDGFQVVNGLQTIETLYEHSSECDNVSLLMRIIPVPEASVLEEHIAEYSNSQTPITARDLRSNDPVQREIERLAFELYDLRYVRKTGANPASRGRSVMQRVDNVDAAQKALALWYRKPYEAKHKKKLLFEREDSATPGFYDLLFNEKTTPEYILLPYFLSKNQYNFINGLPKGKRGDYRNFDFIALSVLGDALIKTYNLSYKPSKEIHNHDHLKEKLPVLLTLSQNNNRNARVAKQLWKPIFDKLLVYGQQLRLEEAKRKKVEVDEISLRNIAVKIRYREGVDRRKINRKVALSQISKQIRLTLG